MNDQPLHRPITSKARGICKYYTTQRGCFAFDKCKFLHTSETPIDPSGSRPPILTPYDKSKRCKYYAAGYCKRGEKCWFLHAAPPNQNPTESDEEEICSICFEKPPIYGLLGGCNHIFCINCMRQWRDNKGRGSELDTIKKCPMCRVNCRLVIPSSRFLKNGEEKDRIIQKYKESMNKVPCKYFSASKRKNPRRPVCPFGKDCLYQHLNNDGTPHVFKHGIEGSMKAWRSRNITFERINVIRRLENPEIDIDAVDMARRIAMGMLGVAEAMQAQTSSEPGGEPSNGVAGGGPRRQRVINDATRRRIRVEMVTDAMTTIRTEISRQLQGSQDGEEIQTVIIPGSMPPQTQSWDVDGDPEGTDSGWGWNNYAPDAAHGADMNLMEHLENLADHMLGSLRGMRRRNGGDAAPHTPPVETSTTEVGTSTAAYDNDHDTDSIPDLQSVSDSCSEDEEAVDIDALGDENNGQTNAIDRHVEATPGNSFEQLPSYDLYAEPETGDVSRLARTTDRNEANRAHGETVNEQDLGHEPAVTTDPPFVTDGRGRVVWSNKDSDEPDS